ncbi:MAG: helix-turn-helix transcriptional regulator [Alphaproteobacteria bacterium]
MLGAEFDLPPLMFTSDELEALALGLRVAVSWGDAQLAGAANRALGKITAVVPPDHQAALAARHIVAPPHDIQKPVSINLVTVRRAVRERLRLTIDYLSVAGVASVRTIRPLTLAFFGSVWLLGGWCEHRRYFRNFRADRISNLVVGAYFPVETGKELGDCKSRNILSPAR